jgi:uncharacterized repeat protein (TIGR01451 family)
MIAAGFVLSVSLLLFVVSAMADAPNVGLAPDGGAQAKIVSVTNNGNGTTTVSVAGGWTWTTHTVDCNTDRAGVGVAVDWNDPSDPGYHVTTLGTTSIDVGSTLGVNGNVVDNTVHPTPGKTGTHASPAGSQNYGAEVAVATSANYANWRGGCGTFDLKVGNNTRSHGYWGNYFGNDPNAAMTHTYLNSDLAKGIQICALMYDLHKNSNNSNNTVNGNGTAGVGYPSSAQEITAGGTNHAWDNSAEENGSTPSGNTCSMVPLPTISTVAHTTGSAVPATLSDTATLGGGLTANATGQITYKLYSDNTCTTQVGSTLTANVNGPGNYTAGGIPVSSPGTFYWIASYGGDTHNLPVSGKCLDANESTTLTKASPTISTNAAPLSVPIVNGGLDLTDTATLSGGSSPTGTITFSLYADNGSGGCGSQVGSSVTKTVVGNGDYTSPTVHVSTVGTYHWIASYGGDTKNNSVSGACKDANENVSVAKASPTISTNAAPLSVTIADGGLDLTDTATLAGGANPTGTITFSLYADSGSGGCGTQVGSSVTKTVVGNGDYTSPAVHVSTVGTYHWIASYGGDPNNNTKAGACNDSNENVTVHQAGPTISTNAAPLSVEITGSGLDLTDTATLSGAANPTGTITFSLYTDSGEGCGSQVGSSVTKTVNGNGDYTSPSIHVSTAGTYHWIVSYGGDNNNSMISGKCGDANENVTVTKAEPSISTDASPLTVQLTSGGLDLTDTATLSDGANPTGLITFSLYTDSGEGCGSQVGSSVTKTVNGNDDYTSPTIHVSTAGKYHWVASYGGDANNSDVSGECGDSNENITITKAGPTIATVASPSSPTLGVSGNDLTDTATLAGGASPTGTITFSLFVDNGKGGCGSQVGSSVTRSVTGNGAYASPAEHITGAGTYHWIASYGGDANNNSVAGNCGDTNENVIVAKANPAISTAASPSSATLGGAGNDLTDAATLAGGVAPTGTITFTLLADNGNGGCAAQVGSSVTTAVNGNGGYTSPSVHVGAAGTYHWVASYSGDTNNNAVAGNCGDSGENASITSPPPPPPPAPPAPAPAPTQNPAISITKSPKGQTVEKGQSATFTIVVTNTGNTTLTNVTVSDPLTTDCAKTSANVAALASMAPGASVTYNCSLANVQSSFTNVATAAGTPPSGSNVTASDSAPVNMTVPLTPPKPTPTHPGITITKSPATQSIGVGGTATFTIKVTNSGDVTLTDVTVNDPQSTGCNKNLGTLGVGQSRTYSCTKDGVSANFTNIATATGKPPTGASVKDTSGTAGVKVAAFTPPQHPAIAVSKGPKSQNVTTQLKTTTTASGANKTAVTYGDAHFTITVTNSGDITLHSVTVSDPQSTNCNKNIGTLAAHASKSYSCTRPAVTANFTNIATATGISPKGVHVHASSSAANVAVSTKTTSTSGAQFTG